MFRAKNIHVLFSLMLLFTCVSLQAVMSLEEAFTIFNKGYSKNDTLTEKNIAQKSLKTRYIQLAKKWHPDTNQGDKSCEEVFKQIGQAYELLETYVLSQLQVFETFDKLTDLAEKEKELIKIIKQMPNFDKTSTVLCSKIMDVCKEIFEQNIKTSCMVFYENLVNTKWLNKEARAILDQIVSTQIKKTLSQHIENDYEKIKTFFDRLFRSETLVKSFTSNDQLEYVQLFYEFLEKNHKNIEQDKQKKMLNALFERISEYDTEKILKKPKSLEVFQSQRKEKKEDAYDFDWDMSPVIHTNKPSLLLFNNNGSYHANITGDYVIIKNTLTYECITKIPHYKKIALNYLVQDALEFSNNESFLVVRNYKGYSKQSYQVFDLFNKKQIFKDFDDLAYQIDLKCSKNGKFIAYFAKETLRESQGIVYVRRLEDEKTMLKLKTSSDCKYSFSPDERYMVAFTSLQEKGYIGIYDLKEREILSHKKLDESIKNLDWINDNHFYIEQSCVYGDFYIYKVANNEVNYVGSTKELSDYTRDNCIKQNLANDLVACYGQDSTIFRIKVYDLKTNESSTYSTENGYDNDVIFSQWNSQNSLIIMFKSGSWLIYDGDNDTYKTYGNSTLTQQTKEQPFIQNIFLLTPYLLAFFLKCRKNISHGDFCTLNALKNTFKVVNKSAVHHNILTPALEASQFYIFDHVTAESYRSESHRYLTIFDGETEEVKDILIDKDDKQKMWDIKFNKDFCVVKGSSKLYLYKNKNHKEKN